MAKKVISLSLEENTIKEIDELSKSMGISRSNFCEMTLRTAVGGQSVHDFTKWRFSSINEKEDRKSDLVTAH